MINFFFINYNYNINNKKKLINNIIYLINKENKKIYIINIIFCNNKYILKLNKKYLNNNKYTDTITFNYFNNKKIKYLYGDIFISLSQIYNNSKKYNTFFYYELKIVIIHSLLHLIGYKDINNIFKKKMFKKQNFYIKKFKNNNFYFN
ncbi:MAG: hypothetical protein RDO_1500 [Flavobacteriales endosymbiont of Rhyzopertha dominica]|nr:MAG: rRNA maturation RNase YbeY [Candidatus Shikimatogenerans bostrichidophilus]